jgi:hypothetical protein
MRILLLFISIIFVSCSTLASIGIFRNKDCEDIDEIKIFQVINDGALAFECKETRYNDCSYGITVFVPSKVNKDYYDGMRIKVPHGKCISFKGTYKYITKESDLKTVPKIEIIDAYSGDIIEK